MALVTAYGFDDAILGIACNAHGNYVVVYDRETCIRLLCEQMPYEDAVEYFDFNVESAYVGECTPLFLQYMDRKQIDNLNDQGMFDE